MLKSFFPHFTIVFLVSSQIKDTCFNNVESQLVNITERHFTALSGRRIHHYCLDLFERDANVGRVIFKLGGKRGEEHAILYVNNNIRSVYM